MTCVITDGRPRVTKHVTWRKGNNTLPTSGRYKLSDNGKVLSISSFNRTLDDGNYSCAATNDVGAGNFSTKFHLQVNCKCAPILSEILMSVTLTALALYVMPTVCVFFCSRAIKMQQK